MSHAADADDLAFRAAFEGHAVAPGAFDHRSHLRLAYVYLTERAPEAAYRTMKASLLGYLDHLGVGDAKYHETLTYGWVRAVHAFMLETAPATGFTAFIEANPRLLQLDLLGYHYSAARLGSPAARAVVLPPDRLAFPGQAG